MPKRPPINKLVQAIVGHSPSHIEIRDYVELCYDLGKTYLTVARKRFLLSEVILTNPDRDLALDSIAELFERDGNGQFVRLLRYYSALGWEDMDENELWTATRRLVCGEISDSLFRFYRMADASLAKIIRNLKRAVNDNIHLDIRKAGGQLSIMLHGESDRIGQSVTPEILESWLSRQLTGNASLNEITIAIVLLLEHFDGVYASISLSMAAICIRNVTVRLQLPLLDEVELASIISVDDLQEYTKRAVSTVVGEKRSFYLAKKRLSAAEFDALAAGVEMRLQSFFSSAQPDFNSNYDACKRAMPYIDQQIYRTKFRNVFEYFFQLSRDELIKILGELQKYSAVGQVGND